MKKIYLSLFLCIALCFVNTVFALDNVFLQKAQAIANKKAQYYQCKIRTSTTKIIRPYMRTPLAIDLKKKFDENSVYKYTNTKTRITYIYDVKSRIAFSYLADAEFIPWGSGTLDWIGLIMCQKRVYRCLHFISYLQLLDFNAINNKYSQ